MVRKKSSRAASRSKAPRNVVECNDTDEESKISLEKRLDDFDRQVAEKIKQMEADKISFLDIIKNFYYLDKQRTPSNINNMLWTDYIKLNSTDAKVSTIRNSIENLINTAEIELNAKTRGRKARAVKNTPAETIRRSNRIRTNNILGDSQIENIPQTNKGRPKRKVMATPVNQNILLKNSLITPKFDMRTPLPPNTVTRLARPGELMVSLQGSPIINSQIQEIIRECSSENLDREGMKALELLKQKLNKAK